MRKSIRIALSILVLFLLMSAAAPALPLKYAKGFEVEDHGAWKLLRVTKPWNGAAKALEYQLVDRGAAAPAVAGALRVEVPVRRLVSFSTSYLAEIAALGEADSIVGVDSAASVYDPALRARIAAGEVKEVAKAFQPDIETLLALKPDVVLAYGTGSEWDTYPAMQAVGLPVVIDGEWNADDPLARAEWIKFIGLFYKKEAAAAKIFDGVAAEYLRIKALAAEAKERPKVIVNAPFQGAWYLAGGRSFAAKLLADAGADYVFSADASTGGVAMSVEAAYALALKAEFWINPGNASSLPSLASMDPRFSALPAARAGRVYNYDKRTSPGGGLDYYESGVLRADVVLGDLVRIFHPGLLGAGDTVYYRKLD